MINIALRKLGWLNERMKNQLKEIIGERFGKLTVASELENYKCSCICDCGERKTVSRYHLMSGATNSCGCILKEHQANNPNTIELNGKRFGSLVVEKYIGKNKRREAVWNCVCDCGNKRDVAGTELNCGNVVSCGCRDKQKSASFVGDGTKTCSDCVEIKPLSEFHVNKLCSDGHVNQCKSCKNKGNREYWMKFRYGITLEKYQDIYDFQDGKCAICLRPFEKLHVDHCHTTNKVRGLLCSPCNTAIGQFGESSEVMLRAIEYLKKPNLAVN